MTDAEKILAKCEFDDGSRAADECPQHMTVIDFVAGAYSENARLLTVIAALLADRERLVEALERLQTVIDDDFMKSTTVDGEEEFWVSNWRVQEITEEALAQSAQTTREIVGGGE